MKEHSAADTRTAYWKAQIDAWQASGQSQLAFCKATDLNYPNFGYWLRKFRRQGMMPVAPRRVSGFVPVVTSPLPGDLTLRLPSGIELCGVNEQNLPLVEHVLARLG